MFFAFKIFTQPILAKQLWTEWYDKLSEYHAGANECEFLVRDTEPSDDFLSQVYNFTWFFLACQS